MGTYYNALKRREAFEKRRRRTRLHLASVIIAILAILTLVIHFV